MLKVRPKRKCTSHLREGVFATVQNYNNSIEILVNIPKTTINREQTYANENQRLQMKFRRRATAKDDVLIRCKIDVTPEMHDGIIPQKLELPIENDILEGKICCVREFFWSNCLKN